MPNWFDSPEPWELDGTLEAVADCGNCGDELEVNENTGEAYCERCDGYTDAKLKYR